MPRNNKLTWQRGVGKRAGRWRKKYNGKVHYFTGGRGKSDRDTYDAAVAEWEQLKVKLDAEAPKPHHLEYERAILEWEAVLAWSRKHNETKMAATAIAKQAVLRRGLSALKPSPVQMADTFAGQFARSERYPDLDKAIKEIGAAVVKAAETYEPGFGMPGYEDYRAATTKFVDGVVGNASVDDIVKAPADIDFDKPDALMLEQNIWTDRLEVMRRSAAPIAETLEAHVDQFLKQKTASANASEITAGRVYTLGLHLTQFMEWLGRGSPVSEINGKTLNGYRVEILQKVEADEWSSATARDRFGSVKSFIRWLWQNEAIPSLPRNMDGKSNALKISNPSPTIVVYEKIEITKLLKVGSERTQLYILLMLNCGMTQKDVSDLDMPEVDWKSERITRKRSKTREFENVPVVSYPLWPETMRLLRQERSLANTGPVLVNEKGKPLWHVEIQQDGKMKKNDNVRNAFNRLRKKTGINKPLKSFKKTSASMIRNNSKYASLESLFLGHAPQSMSDKHYTVLPQTLLDEAITWLGSEYGLIPTRPSQKD